jgi:hypothetical protein
VQRPRRLHFEEHLGDRDRLEVELRQRIAARVDDLRGRRHAVFPVAHEVAPAPESRQLEAAVRLDAPEVVGVDGKTVVP